MEARRKESVDRSASRHILRHACGTQLVAQGVALALIGRWLGHADARMTKRLRAHQSSSCLADTVRASLP